MKPSAGPSSGIVATGSFSFTGSFASPGGVVGSVNRAEESTGTSSVLSHVVVHPAFHVPSDTSVLPFTQTDGGRAVFWILISMPREPLGSTNFPSIAELST